MESAGPLSELLRRPPKRLLDDYDPELDAPIRGPLFPRPIFRALVAIFGGFLMLTVNWFGLLLLNVEGVRLSIGLLNALRVTAVLMTCIAATSALLMVHYRRIYSYISGENVFFAITFSISFMLGFPCGLVAIFG